MMDQFTKTIDAIGDNGVRSSATLQIKESIEEDRVVYKITVVHGGIVEVGESEHGYFDALRTVRRKLEKIGVLLSCFGASEDVYPSPMQESMGPALLAYRNRLGRQALAKDIVNIFDSDDSVRPATVASQKAFHVNWLKSL